MDICGAAIKDTSLLTEMEQDTTIALENLATATTTNRNTLNDLRNTISDQSPQITTLTKNLIAATEAAAKLRTKLATIKRSNRHSGQENGGKGDNQSNSWTRRPLNPNGYCWAHGFRVSCYQTSESCTTKKPSHKDEATRTNTMGGFRRNKHHNFE